MINKCKFVICGDSAVGKTALLTQYIENRFIKEDIPTIGADHFIKKVNERLKIYICAIRGAKDRLFYNEKSFIQSVGAMVIFDITNQESFTNVDFWINKIKELCGNIPFVIIGNKLDKRNERRVKFKDAKKKAKKHNARYIETSAKTGNNIDKAFEHLIVQVSDLGMMKKTNKKLLDMPDNENLKDYRKLEEPLKKSQDEIYDKMPVVQIKSPTIHEEKINKDNLKKKKQNLTIKVYQFNYEFGDFEEQMIDPDVQLKDLLDEDFVLLFVDPQHFRVWLWHGYNTTTRMKFIAAKMAPAIRDKHGITFKITAVDQDNETNEFFDMIGLRETITLEQLLNELGENPFKTPPEIKLLKRFSTIEKGKGKGKSFIPLSSQLGIPGTSYRIQLGLINGKWASRLLKGKNVIDSYVYKEEDLRKKSNRDGDDDDFFFPYPYIFNPPRPPDDFEMEPQVQVRVPLKEKDPEGEVNCQYCGRKLTKEEQITHSCKKKPKST